MIRETTRVFAKPIPTICRCLLTLIVVWPAMSWWHCAVAAPPKPGTGQDGVRGAAKVPLPLQRVQQLIQRHVAHQFAGKGFSVTVRVLAPQKFPNFQGKVTAVELLPDRLAGRTGRRPYRVAVRTGSRTAVILNVVADVQVQGKAVFPARLIRRGEVVTAEDLVSRSFELPTIPSDMVTLMDDVIGKRVVRVLQPNQPIRHAFVSDPPVVEKGDRVVIVARSRGLLVRTFGVAEESGHRGQAIVVVNQDSGRKVHGIVARPGVVEVQF